MRAVAVIFALIGIIQFITLAVERLWPFGVAGVGFLGCAVLLELMARRMRSLDRLPISFDGRFHGPAIGIVVLIIIVGLCFSTLG
ncbi:hypothetical protein ACQCX2_11415 [Propionibacteriaceae bacterium Y1700]|uniref:hypothetical protein n=1 Tax=Microlunatus sp. Y1700 TaxID=3418487 RepID=UPI003DA788E8